MNYPRYILIADDNATIFEFTSFGRYGEIRKVIRFTPTENELVYNLGFGNKVETLHDEELEIDDKAINNNGDRNKILATIAEAVFIFTKQYPDKYIVFTGNSSSRNRLYRMAISINLDELTQNFSIFGILYDESKGSTNVIPFKKGINFDGFLIRRIASWEK